MDFNQYTLKLADIPQGLLSGLTVAAHEQLVNPKVKRYFSPAPLFQSGALPCNYADERPIVKQAIDLLQPFFKPEQYTSCEVNSLEPKGTIKEHTDQSSAVTVDGINAHYGTLVSSWHSVHIPLTGFGEYYFRRDHLREERTLEQMLPGSAYLFNNYVLHSVLNPGPERRINMILHFYDKTWESKHKIYQYFGIKGVY